MLYLIGAGFAEKTSQIVNKDGHFL